MEQKWDDLIWLLSFKYVAAGFASLHKAELEKADIENILDIVRTCDVSIGDIQIAISAEDKDRETIVHQEIESIIEIYGYKTSGDFLTEYMPRLKFPTSTTTHLKGEA